MAKLLSKKIKRKLKVLLVPPLANLMMFFIYITSKKRYHFDKAKVKDTPSVVIFWHGEIIMMPYAYRDYRHSTNMDIIVSRHHDGDISARMIRIFGGGTVRGSSSKGGAQALKEVFRCIKRGRDIGLTPDGPRGPRHSVADGAALIAQKKDIPIVAMNCRASKSWRLKSWDKLFIPKPFCTLDFYYSDPFYVTDLSIEDAKKMIKEKLMVNAD